MDIISFFNKNQDDRLKDWSLLLLRLAFGFMMIYGHGWKKLMKLTSGEEVKFFFSSGTEAEIWLTLVVLAEVVCAILLILGLLTRAAAIPLLITMLVAIFIIHINDPFKKIEFATMYAVPYLVLILQGAGRISLDYRIFGRY